MNEEIWKPIKNFEGLYEASTYGNLSEEHKRKLREAHARRKEIINET